jgi:hypothetical protein
MEVNMKSKRYPTYILSLFMVVAGLISSCNFDNVTVGGVRVMYGSNEDGHISYNYSIFSGIESGSLEVEVGQRIQFDYEVTVDKGSLLIEWQDPDGEAVWQKVLLESESGGDVIIAKSSGAYRIIIQGKNAGGDFDIAWTVDES